MSPNNPTVSDFLATHRACTDGALWAIRSFGPDVTMAQAFEAAKSFSLPRDQAEWVVWAMIRFGVLSLAHSRRFSLYCAKTALAYTEDQRVHAAVKTVEAYLDGKATEEEMATARAALVTTWADTDGRGTGGAAYAAYAAADAAAATSLVTAADAAHCASGWAAAYNPALVRKDQVAYLLRLPNPWA